MVIPSLRVVLLVESLHGLSKPGTTKQSHYKGKTLINTINPFHPRLLRRLFDFVSLRSASPRNEGISLLIACKAVGRFPVLDLNSQRGMGTLKSIFSTRVEIQAERSSWCRISAGQVRPPPRDSGDQHRMNAGYRKASVRLPENFPRFRTGQAGPGPTRPVERCQYAGSTNQPPPKRTQNKRPFDMAVPDYFQGHNLLSKDRIPAGMPCSALPT